MERITPMLYRIRRTWPVVVVMLGVVGAGSTAMLSSAVAAPAHRGRPPGPTLPPSWPADVPVPPGRIEGSTASAGQWSLLLLVDRSAAAAHTSTVAFYVARGFRRLSDSVVQKGTRRVTVVVENRDHSPNRTFILVAVTTTGVPASGRLALRARMSGRAGRAGGRAAVTITGGRACWTIRNLHGVGRPSTATIREGAAGRTGPVMVRLGRRYRASGCTTIPAALGQSIAARPRGFYVAVGTRAHPGGAVRGQLRR